MAQHYGIVKEIENGGFARVLTDRHGACGGCTPSGGGCRSCLAGANKLESRVANPIGACAGDVVKVQLTAGNLFAGAAILYLVPVAALMLGALIGNGYAVELGLSELSGGLAGALVGVVLGYLAVIAFDRNATVRRRLMPRITEVMSSQISPQGSNRMRSSG